MSKAKVKRPNQTYFEMGLKRGDRLTFEQLPDVEVYVKSGRTLEWSGREIYMTQLLKELGLRQDRARYSGRILVNSRDYHELYNETYTKAGS